MNGFGFGGVGRLLLVAAAVMAGSVGLIGTSATAGTARAAISGTVRDAVTGQPVEGVSVTVFYLASNGLPDGSVVHGPGYLTGTQTAADGTYRVGLPPSDANGYWVCFDTGINGPYEFQCWADQSTFFLPFPDALGFFQLPTFSRAIPLSAGQHVGGVDGDLIRPVDPGSPSPTGSVTGRVTAAATDTGVAGATVVAFNDAGLPVGHTVSALHGAYELDNLPPSNSARICVDPTYAQPVGSLAEFHGRCYATARWHSGSPPAADAAPVTITVGVTVRHVNIALLPGAGG